MGQALWLLVVACHAAAAATWWWTMAHGFPASSPEYWMNEAGPLVIVVLCAAALLPPQRLRAAVFPALTGALPLFWMSLALSARLTFPRSIGLAWNVTFFLGLALGVIWWREVRPRLAPAWLLACLALPALWGGWSVPSTQRAPEPSTHPVGGTLAELPKGAPAPQLVKLGKAVQLHPSEARVVLRRDQLVLAIDPLLSFLDRSPDRTWVNLAQPEDARPTRRRLVGARGDRKGWSLDYADEDRSTLAVTPRDDGVLLEAVSRLAEPVFAHLDTYAELTLRGHRKLSISFSAAPDARIDFPSFGVASRFAYVDAARVFHVAEATKLDKGPFHELARGSLPASAPLTVTLYDANVAVFTITLADWSAQASTALSPAAGDGICVNDIEFAHGTDGETAPAYVIFSLAATGIGRGYQSVGHAPGTYRNRMTVTLP